MDFCDGLERMMENFLDDDRFYSTAWLVSIEDIEELTDVIVDRMDWQII